MRRSIRRVGAIASAWGMGSRKLAGPAIAASDLGEIDAVLLSHDHHQDNLRRRRSGVAAIGRRRHHQRRRRETRRERCARPRAVGEHAARGVGTGSEAAVRATPNRRPQPASPSDRARRRAERRSSPSRCARSCTLPAGARAALTGVASLIVSERRIADLAAAGRTEVPSRRSCSSLQRPSRASWATSIGSWESAIFTRSEKRWPSSCGNGMATSSSRRARDAAV
jgi:hypothetical protein